MNQNETIDGFIRLLKGTTGSKNHLASHHVLPERAPVYGYLEKPIPDVLSRLLSMEAEGGLYLHQAEALNLARNGENVVLSTPTASGKSLVYNLLLFERILSNPSAKALYIFPLKALAQDQLRGFQALASRMETATPAAAVYDGDTSAYQRRKIRQAPPAVIMTNPEMIHLSILPYHDRWERLLRHLSLIVVDELHVYRGLWGAHMAQVLRRLQRMCAFYRSRPNYLFCSATIGNPGELAEQMIGAPVRTVQKGGAPSGKKHFIFTDPVAATPAAAAVELLESALKMKLRTIVYTRSRKLAERITLMAASSCPEYAKRISVYRAGFTAEERRRIERRLSTGKLRAVISTSALELGIDIGNLDLCILVGFPGSVMATFQRSGRVGRRGNEAAVIFIAGEDALDRYYLKHPGRLVFGKPESAMVNPENQNILSAHLPCAAAELPLTVSEPMMNNDVNRGCATSLSADGQMLTGHDGLTWYAKRKFPQRFVSLRGVGDRYQILLNGSGEILGEVDGYRAFRETHPGAIYLHRSETYRVTKLDIQKRTVWVEALIPDHYTKVRSREETEILEAVSSRNLGRCRICFGSLRVTEEVTGYEIWQIRPHRRRDIRSLNLPPMTYETEGIWIVLNDRLLSRSAGSIGDVMGGLHAFEHAAIGISPLIVLCDRDDLGGVSTTFHPQLGTPGIFVYDGLPGGAGIGRELYKNAEELLQKTLTVISDCPCESGCPSCIHSPKCGSGNRPMDKDAAVRIIKAVMPKMSMQSETGASVRRSCGDSTEREDGRPISKEKGLIRNLKEGRTEKARYSRRGSHGRREEKSVRYLVFDLETQRSAAEVGGWHRADRMKISCAVAYDAGTRKYREYREKDVPRLIRHLQNAELVIGFNSKRFDYKVLSGYDEFDFWSLPSLDLLEQVHLTLGFRLSLDHLAKETLGAQKSGDGLQALRWWKQGRMSELLAYCRKDVELTRSLFLFGRNRGYLLFKNKLGHRLRAPVQW